MKNFKRLDLIFGWLMFLIAAITYLLTIEPTASLWDCGEFITSGYKLEVGHPPGAPLFAMMGRLFAMFAPSADKVAVMMNAMSALASAFTILFLFWTITHLMRKYFGKKHNELSTAETIITIGCGIVGSLAYTWSDSFWYSAVEGEVYATSSLFTAVVFWAALKWEEVADTKYSNRWLILIAYLTGLSIGVHLLNLLVVPAIAMIYYFRKYKPTTKGTITAILIGGLILAGVLYVIVPWVPRIAFWFDYVFANTLGLPVNAGTLFFVVAFAALLSYLIYRTHKKGRALANTIVLCVAMISLGFTSYAMILIRASANTPMEQNNPDNIRALMSYLNREQYGSWPLFSGPYYTAPAVSVNATKLMVEHNGKYEELNESQEYVYDKRFTTIFPRMHKTDAQYAGAYRNWGQVVGTQVPVVGQSGRPENRVVPTFGENLRFMFSYQIGWMYWRYFMWNFAGRQNDYQGHGDCLHGNWISGINFIDEARLGPQDDLPSFLKNNKARNRYFMLPLLLGILGIVMQWMRNKKDFSVVFMLFFLTGIAIILYLNQTPYQPRERDYAYSGSFYAFAIWIGIGVVGLYELIKKISPKTIAASAASIISLAVPIIMVEQNWDDHDRSGRYITADFGKNYLSSCGKNGLVFTYGDNDTFALWYAQEVENYRTDVRVANISYLYSDWYYNQLMHTYYDSQAFNLMATPDKIVGVRRNFVPVFNDTTRHEFKSALAKVMDDSPAAKRKTNYSNEPLNYFSSNKMKITIDKNKFRNNKIINDTLSDDMIYDQLNISLPNFVYKNMLAGFDIIVNNFADRPIYMGHTAMPEYMEPFKNYLQSVGLAYLITPEKLTEETAFDVDKNYDLFMNEFSYRGLNNPKIYWDESSNRLVMDLYRKGFSELAKELILRNDTVRAKAVLDKFEEAIPIGEKPYLNHALNVCQYRYIIDDVENADNLATKTFEKLDKELQYYSRLNGEQQAYIARDIAIALSVMQGLNGVVSNYGKEELAKKISEAFSIHKSRFAYIAKEFGIQ